MISKAVIKIDNYVGRNIIPFAIVYFITGIVAGVISGTNK